MLGATISSTTVPILLANSPQRLFISCRSRAACCSLASRPLASASRNLADSSRSRADSSRSRAAASRSRPADSRSRAAASRSRVPSYSLRSTMLSRRSIAASVRVMNLARMVSRLSIRSSTASVRCVSVATVPVCDPYQRIGPAATARRGRSSNRPPGSTKPRCARSSSGSKPLPPRPNRPRDQPTAPKTPSDAPSRRPCRPRAIRPGCSVRRTPARWAAPGTRGSRVVAGARQPSQSTAP